ncbi:MAG: hypothetical protein VW443_04715 [Pseudomonadales bacterium]|jgi:small nuclear ribonucleoprotein (snRNP)-like protein
MNRGEFIKRMGAAALIPFVPNVVDNRPVVDLGYVTKREIPAVGGGDRRTLTNYIDSKITLVTNDDPINYRTVVHAYDMTLETVMDEYTPYDNVTWSITPYDNEFLRAGPTYERTMTLSNLPDNYDKYELSVWRTERSGLVTVDDVVAHWNVQPTKVFSRTYDLGFPSDIFINLTGRNA